MKPQLNEKGQWDCFAWPGGYEIYYITEDNGVLCHKCANDNVELTIGDDPQWKIVAADINYECDDVFCDNCNEQIKPEYSDN